MFSAKKALLEACAQGTVKTVRCRLYGRDDGLPTLGCAIESQPTAWRGRDGRLWFATASGVAYVQPREVEANQQPPLVVIEEVRVDGRVQAPEAGGPAYSGTAAVRPAARQPVARLDIGPGRHHLQFRYTGLSFTAPDRVRFKY